MTNPTLSSARKWGTLVICCLAQLLIALDMTVLHLAIPAISGSLKPSSTQILWIADMYGFALAGFLVTMGNIGDRIGRKKLLLIGSAVFGVASVLTAYANGPEMLIGARALLGVAGATLMPSTLSLIRNVFTDPKERTGAIGAWSGVAVLGIGFGPVIAGTLLANFWWGSVFLINVPVVVVLLVAGFFVLPESRNPNPGKLDALSVLLSVAGMLGVVYTIKEVAASGFKHTDVIAAAVIGVLSLGVFVHRQGKLAEPLIDVKLFAQRAFSATIGTTVVAMFVQLALSLALAQYFQLVVGWSPLKSGLAGLPGMVGALIGGTLAGVFVSKFGRRATVMLGCALSSTGFVLLAQTPVDVNYPLLVLCVILCGFGVAMMLTVATDTVLGVVPKERAGAASAISETANELGGALGIAILGSVLGALYRTNLQLPAGLGADVTGPIKENIGAAVATASQLPGDLGSLIVNTARHAYVDSLGITFYVCAGLMAALAVSVWFTMRGVPKVIETDEDAVLEPVAV
ncbi:MFS transporter [Amycolatopsis sp. cg5]|uniref:MFS transporter n=1 Tax=Amycolatopsis sp. cg5 TaxID=3238802 RepID=UPI0035269F41